MALRPRGAIQLRPRVIPATISDPRAARISKMDPNTPVDEVFTPQEMGG